MRVHEAVDAWYHARTLPTLYGTVLNLSPPAEGTDGHEGADGEAEGGGVEKGGTSGGALLPAGSPTGEVGGSPGGELVGQ